MVTGRGLENMSEVQEGGIEKLEAESLIQVPGLVSACAQSAAFSEVVSCWGMTTCLYLVP